MTLVSSKNLEATLCEHPEKHSFRDSQVIEDGSLN